MSRIMALSRTEDEVRQVDNRGSKVGSTFRTFVLRFRPDAGSNSWNPVCSAVQGGLEP